MIRRDTQGSNKNIFELGGAFATSENLGGCVAGCESNSIRVAVECECARVHDAVRRANPNQFVMTLFSSRASLARRRRAAERDFALLCLCLCACLQAGIEYSRETRVRATQLFIAAPSQLALPSICMICRQPARPY